VPKPATLRKYGLTAREWRAILKEQGGGCAVCRKVPKSGRLCVDHEHVPGWKRMKPEQRKKYVRGILCFFCNHYYMGRAITVKKARNVYRYLLKYDHQRQLRD
jgi:hypothetical protein